MQRHGYSLRDPRLGRRRVLVEQVGGEEIFQAAEVMTPLEFLQKYSGKMPEDLTAGPEVGALTEWVFEQKSTRRIPTPPQKNLGVGDVKGSNVSDEELADALGARGTYTGVGKKRKAGSLPRKMPYIHPQTAQSTFVGDEGSGSMDSEDLVQIRIGKGPPQATTNDGVVVVDAVKRPIDLSVLKRILTNYDNPKFTILKQNEKMKKSTTGELEAFFNVGIPAIMGLVFDEASDSFKIINTCPSAGYCLIECYATKGGYVQYRGVSERQNLTLNLLWNRPGEYIEKAVKELVRKTRTYAKKNIKSVFRWHDSGDFFSEDYLRLVYHIIERTTQELGPFAPMASFYAYTKRVNLTNKMLGQLTTDTTSGLLLRKSLGAKGEDEREINPTKDMFSQIVPKEVKKELEASGAIYHVPKTKKGVEFDGTPDDENPEAWDKEMEGKWVYRDPQAVKDAILASPKIKFKNDYPMLTMEEYENVEDTLGASGEKVNVIILPGENDRPAKDTNVAGVYLMYH